jgi:hypothetical protein
MTHHRTKKTTTGVTPALVAMLIALPAVLTACGEAPPPPPIDEEMAPPAPADPMEGVLHATTPLLEVNGSGVSGEAVAMHSDDAVVVVLDLEGLPAEGEYAAHIHQGTCAEGGPVAAPLNPVLGLADGTGTSTTTLDPGDVPSDESLFIQVHGEGGTPIACGDMEGHPVD